jgi:serine/threonine protein kinase
MSDPQTHATFLAPEIADLAPLFPGYEIETLIATGGMGAVYRAVQKSLDRTVAIKILPQEFSKDAAFCAGFEAEAKAMARLNHPNLIGVYDFGEVNGMLYIIMEFVPGQSVFDSAHGIAIDPREVIRLVTAICNGLSHAHENGILHRDIKPSNILLDLNTQPKIGDFGLARPIGTKVQEGEEIFGTPHYTAPEVVNSPQSVGYRADIFSVGVMLHELLTGKLPAEDQRPASAIVHCDPRFDAIIRRATNTLPDLRYASASEIAKDLQAIAASMGPKVMRSASPKGPPRAGAGRTASAAARTRKSNSSGPGIAMLIIAILVGVFSYKHFTKTQPPTKKPAVEVTKVVPEETHEETKRLTINPDLPIVPKSDSDSEAPPNPLSHNDSTSDQTSDSDSMSKSATDSSDEALATPKFDVEGFFERARKIMRDRANPLIASRNANLGKNLEDFERGIKRLVRKIDYRETRETAEDELKEYMARCKANGNRIPKLPNPQKFWTRGIHNLRGFAGVHSEFFDKQTAIDDHLIQSLSQLAPTYILGLQKQIERLQGTNDPAAIALIEQEIEKTRDHDDYFPNLMSGDEDENENGMAEKTPLKFEN